MRDKYDLITWLGVVGIWLVVLVVALILMKLTLSGGG